LGAVAVVPNPEATTRDEEQVVRQQNGPAEALAVDPDGAGVQVVEQEDVVSLNEDTV
jgi:hypothetical protein